MRSCPDPLTPPVLHERETEGDGYREAEGKTCRPASRLWLFLGALNGLVSVAAGAYGRHGALEAAAREMFGIAAQYQMAHALALLAAAWLASRHEGGWLTAPNASGAAFTMGILLFSGSLLVRADGPRSAGRLGADRRLLADVRLARADVDRPPAWAVERTTVDTSISIIHTRKVCEHSGR